MKIDSCLSQAIIFALALLYTGLPDVKAQTGEIIEMSAGVYHTVVIKDDGTVWAWGETEMGSLATVLRPTVIHRLWSKILRM